MYNNSCLRAFGGFSEADNVRVSTVISHIQGYYARRAQVTSRWRASDRGLLQSIGCPLMDWPPFHLLSLSLLLCVCGQGQHSTLYVFDYTGRTLSRGRSLSRLTSSRSDLGALPPSLHSHLPLSLSLHPTLVLIIGQATNHNHA